MINSSLFHLSFLNFRSMAYSLNRAQIIGNVTRDPEVRMAGSQKVATFSVATNFSWKDQTGARKEKVEFHNVVAWRKLAEICELYLKKGSKIYIEGRMQTRDWEGPDGVKRYKTEILADSMIMLDKKGAGSGAGASVNASAQEDDLSGSSFQPARTQRAVKDAAPQKAAQEAPQEEEISIDDLPF